MKGGSNLGYVNVVKTLLKDSKLSCVIFEKLDYHLPDDLFPLLMISRYNFTIWILYNPCWLIFEMTWMDSNYLNFNKKRSRGQNLSMSLSVAFDTVSVP